MNNNKTTKRALCTSIVALLICFTMLIGTTYAWFTDSVTSSGNKIQAGTLDVELWQHFADKASVNISDSSDPIFGKADSTTANANTADTLWEPGKTQTVYFSIKNNGTLDLKYKVAIVVSDITKNLNKVLTYVITPDAKVDAPVAKADLDWSTGSSVVSGYNEATVGDTPLTAGSEHFFALSVHMDELAGNEYQGGSITFDIKVVAGQLASEFDSFDNQYDAEATYPNDGAIFILPDDLGQYPSAGRELEKYDDNTGEKIATATVPSAAIAEDAKIISLDAEVVETNGNITVQTGYEAITYDVSVSGLKANNDVPVIVKLRIPAGLDPNTVKVYHYETEIHGVYTPEEGLVIFETATFSPFTLVFDPNSEYVEGVVLPEDLPTATVTNSPEYENVSLAWGSFGGWSPDENIDADPKLESAFTFACNETGEEAENSPYANWYCDFYVKLDRDLGADEIFLGGNYGNFGWVGFHNGDFTLEANKELPLLGSVTSNPWTYALVASNVGTFICGVGDVNNALSGATFTVMLRLTNPENTNEYYNVATINYSFE